MTSRDEEFLQLWRSERHHYERWGHLVLQRLLELVAANVPPSQASNFVRIPAKSRLKEEESLLQKAFYRPEKNYSSPYEDIEDKVGVRLVLLLNEDVQLLAKAISNDSKIWSSLKARDHELEKAEKPYEFVYQSVHFVVRSKEGLEHADGSPLVSNLPCEIQVRTLLQHAHSEVTHDTLYKPSIQTTPEMKRASAKSMALIEATGDYFDQLAVLIAEQVEPLRKIEIILERRYKETVGHNALGSGSPLNDMVLDRYGRELDVVAMESWLDEWNYIGPRVASHATRSAAFRLPAILLIYYRAATEPYGTAMNSPLPDADLEVIYSDLGQSMYG